MSQKLQSGVYKRGASVLKGSIWQDFDSISATPVTTKLDLIQSDTGPY